MSQVKVVYGIGIIGCGLIGRKRAHSLGSRGKLVSCADIDEKRAKTLAEEFGASSVSNSRDLLSRADIDIVIISTLHDTLAEIAIAAIEAGKHVLVEKPAARFPSELSLVLQAEKKSSVKVRVGFNHRYHRALQKAKALVDAGELGELMFIRGRYGHGGRVGYEKEWRANPQLSGGGELIDQGPHLIDLSRWFLGNFSEIDGFAHTYFWEMPVDDNSFMMLKTPKKQTAFLHVSCTEWKNLFSMEIYGKVGKIEISGLGGSYGLEKITHYKMLPVMGPPVTTSWEYPMGDISWSQEMSEFYDDIELNRRPAASLSDAYEVLKIIQTIYHGFNNDH